MSTEVQVQELPPCDICKANGVQKDANYDAATSMGGWAYLCELHFSMYAYGLGTGRGQRLIVSK